MIRFLSNENGIAKNFGLIEVKISTENGGVQLEAGCDLLNFIKKYTQTMIGVASVVYCRAGRHKIWLNG